MQFFFADDSTQLAARPSLGRIISFGGVFVEGLALKPLSAELEALADEFSLPLWTELKWSPRKSDWIYSNLVGVARSECFAKLIDAAEHHGARVLVVSWAQGRSSLKTEEAFDRVLDYTFERVSLHLNSIDQEGLLISDRPGGGRKDEDKFLEHFRIRTQFGTGFVPPERVLLNVLTTDSKMVRLLQVADIVVGATTAMVGGLYDYAPPVYDHIRPMFVTNSLGQIGGCGLKIAPDRLENLYYWLLGELEYKTTAGRRALHLPDRARPYGREENVV